MIDVAPADLQAVVGVLVIAGIVAAALWAGAFLWLDARGRRRTSLLDRPVAARLPHHDPTAEATLTAVRVDQLSAASRCGRHDEYRSAF